MQDLSDIRLQRSMAAVRDESVLRGRLEEIVRRKGLQTVCVGVAVDGREIAFSACAAEADDRFGATAASETPVAARCLAKSLTATLVNEAVVAGRVGWTDAVADLLGGDTHSRRHLAGITVRHLLDHAHGLDASMVYGVPRTDDGFIDVGRLCGELGPQPLFGPWQMYSYSHVDAWLAGALLERITGVRYATQLRERQLICNATYDESGAICPATGGHLALTIAQWLVFAQRCLAELQPRQDDTYGDMALPGWHPTERSIFRGWKCYGDGWLGHNANLSDRSAMLRINPGEQLAIVVSASEANGAVFAASGVFGDLLPEFRNLRPPRLLKADEVAGLALHAHVGRYVQARTTVNVTLDAQGALQLQVGERDQRGHAAEHVGSAADRGLFLAESRGNPEFQFVQFVADAASSAIGIPVERPADMEKGIGGALKRLLAPGTCPSTNAGRCPRTAVHSGMMHSSYPVSTRRPCSARTQRGFERL